MKRTPLYSQHVEMGAKISPFAGFEMPVSYSGITDEHLTVRKGVGVFDVSHMGEFLISGKDAFLFLQDVSINDISTLDVGTAQYSAMCFNDGGIVDDLIIYRRTDSYLLVVNAANIEQDFQWLQSNLKGEVTLEDHSERYALIAIQGPRSRELTAALTGRELSGLQFYQFIEFESRGHPIILSRTGYTGELGFELYCPPEAAPEFWAAIFQSGQDMDVKPVGLGARDTLRLEMKYCLYGYDIDAETNPIEAGLGWITKLDKGPFIGRETIAGMKSEGPSRRLVAFEMLQRGIPRHDYPIWVGGKRVGRVTSGTQSPSLKKGIGLGYLDRPFNRTGQGVQVMIRGKAVPARVIKPPFVKGTSLLE